MASSNPKGAAGLPVKKGGTIATDLLRLEKRHHCVRWTLGRHEHDASRGVALKKAEQAACAARGLCEGGSRRDRTGPTPQ